MPIEFRCTHCDRLLRTPDGTSGKDAKCPQCGTVVQIPEAGLKPSPPPPAPELSPRVDSGNPYQSPAASTMAAAPHGEVHRGFHPTRIEMGDVLSRTWQIFKANMWPCVGVAMFILVLSWGESIVFGVATAGRQPTLSEHMVNLVFIVVQIWLTLGQMIFLLKVARGEPATFSDVFSGGPFLLPFLGLWFIVTVLFTIGLILLIIPGFVVMMMFAPAFLVLIDQKAGVIESLRMSREATAGNKLTLFALYLIAVFGGGMFAVVTCLLGTVFVQPFVTLLFCVCYLAMTGQSTAEQAYPRQGAL